MNDSILCNSTTPALISGVEIKELKTFGDNRGFFRELIRHNDTIFAEGFGQWSHSHMIKNTVKAWHYHHIQTDWWYLSSGLVQVVLFDLRPESTTFEHKMVLYLGDPITFEQARAAIVKIPPGVAHSCKVESDSAELFYITSHTYNPNDEGRWPFDSERIPHSWGNTSELIVAENDKKAFVPTSPRELPDKNDTQPA